MADQCIVCLGDLSITDSSAPEAEKAATNHVSSRGAAQDNADNAHDDAGNAHNAALPAPENELVAHLRPCGHNLHDECLKPWVERANSCPICRTNFNMVELSKYIGGPVVDSYPVQDKQQIAELDPSMVTDDLFGEAETDTPCFVCSVSNEGDILLLCDGCNQCCHIFCAGLDSVPAGAWFCYDCMSDERMLQRAAENTRPAPAANLFRIPPGRRPGRNTNDARRHIRRSEREWARVWERIEQNTGIDIEFPFENSGDDMNEIERLLQRERWEQRAQVASRHGAGQQFRQAAPINRLAAAREAPRPRPEPESQEEIRAWNAFDKERQLKTERDGTRTTHGNRRKRKSATTSPTEPQLQPERPLKRPRTRRIQESHGNGESSASAAASVARASDSEPSAAEARRRASSQVGRPSFLQSLLKEVESGPTPAAYSPDAGHGCPPGLDTRAFAFAFASVFTSQRSSSPRPASPDASPMLSSRDATPGAMTASSSAASPRPISPPLTSNTNTSPAVWPSPPAYSFFPAPMDESSPRYSPHGSPRNESGSRRAVSVAVAVSVSTKGEVQRMVKVVLRPLYQQGRLDKHEFTEINKKVSRMLYARVAEHRGGLADEAYRAELQRLAREEVGRAMAAMGKSAGTEAGPETGPGPVPGPVLTVAAGKARVVEAEAEADGD